MVLVPLGAARWGLRAPPRRSSRLAAVGLIVAAALVGCGTPTGSTSPAVAGSTVAPSGVVVDSGDPGTSSAASADAIGLERIGGVELQVASYDVPDVLDAAGGDELTSMLETLGLQPADVSLEIAVDPAGSLAIGRWQLPDRDADDILAAWGAAAGSGWRSENLAGQPALSGLGPDGGAAWATARDGVFLYIVTDDRDLAEAAARSLPQ